MGVTAKRPRYLNLVKIKLPVTGILSIFHRITGVLLFVAIPFSLYLMQLSLVDEAAFDEAFAYINIPFTRFLILIIFWSILHHLLCGIRFLLIDLEIGVDKLASRLSAWLVVILEIAILATLLMRLFL